MFESDSDDSEFDIESETARREKKMAAKKRKEEEDNGPRPGRLKPFEKSSRQFDWRVEIEEENDE